MIRLVLNKYHGNIVEVTENNMFMDSLFLHII